MLLVSKGEKLLLLTTRLRCCLNASELSPVAAAGSCLASPLHTPGMLTLYKLMPTLHCTQTWNTAALLNEPCQGGIWSCSEGGMPSPQCPSCYLLWLRCWGSSASCSHPRDKVCPQLLIHTFAFVITSRGAAGKAA